MLFLHSAAYPGVLGGERRVELALQVLQVVEHGEREKTFEGHGLLKLRQTMACEVNFAAHFPHADKGVAQVTDRGAAGRPNEQGALLYGLVRAQNQV